MAATIDSKNKKAILEYVKNHIDESDVLVNAFLSDEAKKYLNDAKFMAKVVKIDKNAIKLVNLEVARELIKKDGALLKQANYDVRADEKTVFLAVSQNPQAIKDANSKFLANEEIALQSVRGSWKMLAVVDKKFRGRYDFAAEALSQSLDASEFISPTLIKNNKDIAIKLADKTDISLNSFSKGMKKNREVVDKYIEKDATNIRYAVGKIRFDEQLAEKAVILNKEVYKYLPKKMQVNAEVAKALVKQDGLLARKLKGNVANLNEVAEIAVAENGMALKYYKNSSVVKIESIVRIAVESNGAALKYANVKWKSDRDMVILAVSQNTRKQYDPKAKKPLSNHPLQYADKKLRKNADVMMASVMNEGLSLKFGNYKITKNKDIVLEAVKNNGEALQYASKSLKKNPEIVSKALSNSTNAIKYVSEKFLNNPKNGEALLKALNDNPELYNSFPKALQENPKAIMYAIEVNADAIKNLPLANSQDEEYMLQIAARNPEAFRQGLSIKLSVDEKFIKKSEKLIESVEREKEAAKKQEVDEANPQTKQKEELELKSTASKQIKSKESKIEAQTIEEQSEGQELIPYK